MTDIALTVTQSLPDFVERFVRAFGLATINWGRMEQLLELLLRIADDPTYNTSEAGRFPTTSFRLKVEKFKWIYANHPSFAPVHNIARHVCVGLKTANKSRVLLIHCAVQNFDAGPPSTVRVQTIKGKGPEFIQTFSGTWPIDRVEELSDLLDSLWHDLQTIAQVTSTAEFRQSLCRELSRSQRALVWFRRHRARLRHLCNRLCGAQD
jgi:hypothetical protein